MRLVYLALRNGEGGVMPNWLHLSDDAFDVSEGWRFRDQRPEEGCQPAWASF